MTATWWLGTVRGVRVGVHWSVLLLVLVVSDALAETALPSAAPGHATGAYWLAGVCGAVVLATGVLLHELSHVRTAQRHGLAVGSVVLWGLGGVSELETDPADPDTELRVALAGPLASLAIALVLGTCAAAAAALHAGDLAVSTLSWTAGTNVVLALFNLLPGAPLDGGRVLRAALWRRSGDPVAAAAAAGRAGQWLGAGLMTLGFLELFTTGDLGGLWLVLLGWFIATSAVSEARYRLALAALGDLRVGTVMSAHPTCAPADWTVADFLDHRARIAPYPSYPVTDPAGRPVGLLRIAQAVQLSSDDRQSSAVSLVCTPMSDCLIIAETDRVADVLPRVARLRGDDAAIVTHHGIVSGLLSPSDLNRAVRVASALGSPTS